MAVERKPQIGDQVGHPIFPLLVNFVDGTDETYMIDGKRNGADQYPDLYWNEINFTPPSPPERWVTKEKWIAFFRGDEGQVVCVHGPGLFDTYEEAVSGTDEMCPDPIKVLVKEKED